MRNNPYYTTSGDIYREWSHRASLGVLAIMLFAVIYLVGGLCYDKATRDSHNEILQAYATGFNDCAEMAKPTSTAHTPG